MVYMDKYMDTFDFFRHFNENKHVDIDWLKCQIYGNNTTKIPETFPDGFPTMESIIYRVKLDYL